MFKVLFFGATADIAGSRVIEADEAALGDAGAVLAEMKRRFPRLDSHKLFLAVNQQHASGSELVGPGDEVAIFTAVSGG